MAFQRQAQAALLPEKRSSTYAQEAGSASEQVWTVAENLALQRASKHGPSSPYAIPASSFKAERLKPVNSVRNEISGSIVMASLLRKHFMHFH
jgi:hypothetical protein